jgi:ankyrin repeat protein
MATNNEEPLSIEAWISARQQSLFEAIQRGDEPVRLFGGEMSWLLGTVNESGVSGLHIAAFSGRKNIADYLLVKAPSLISVKDDRGLNAAHFAALGGHEDLMSALLKRVPDLAQERNARGYTPIELMDRKNTSQLPHHAARVAKDRKDKGPRQVGG